MRVEGGCLSSDAVLIAERAIMMHPSCQRFTFQTLTARGVDQSCHKYTKSSLSFRVYGHRGGGRELRMLTYHSVLSTCGEPLSYGYTLNAMIRIRIGRFRYRQVKCPYGVVGKASALSAGKREQVECPYRVAGKASALGAGNDIPKSAY